MFIKVLIIYLQAIHLNGWIECRDKLTFGVSFKSQVLQYSKTTYKYYINIHGAITKLLHFI